MKRLTPSLAEIYVKVAAKPNLQDAIDYLITFDELDIKDYEIIKENVKEFFAPKMDIKKIKDIKINDRKIEEINEWHFAEENEMKKIDWHCSKLGLRPGPITILSAFSNVGKTFFAADLAICFANGLKFLDTIEIEKPGKVLHLDFELGEQDAYLYYWRLLNGHNIKTFDNISYSYPKWNLITSGIETTLINSLKEYDLCIIDCFGAAVPGVDINKDEVRQYIDMLNRVSASTGCVILLVHHEPKNANSSNIKSIKGNGSIISAAGGSIHLHKKEGSEEITVSLGKKRLVKYFETKYTLDDCGFYSEKLKMMTGIKLNPIKGMEKKFETSNYIKVLEIINIVPGIGVAELRSKLPIGKDEVDNIVFQLLENNLITIEGKKPKKHTITEEGRNKLAYQS